MKWKAMSERPDRVRKLSCDWPRIFPLLTREPISGSSPAAKGELFMTTIGAYLYLMRSLIYQPHYVKMCKK
jgi:hypothetical protein